MLVSMMHNVPVSRACLPGAHRPTYSSQYQSESLRASMFTWCFLFGITRHASIIDNTRGLMNIINGILVGCVREGESQDCQREASSVLLLLGSCVCVAA